MTAGVKIRASYKGKKFNSIEGLVREIQQEIRGRVLIANQAIAMRIADELWNNTPVVTGNTKSSWNVISAGQSPVWDPSARGHQPVSFGASAPAMSLRIVNTAPACYFVELRSGFIRTTMMDYKDIINDAVRDLRRK